MEFSGTHVIAAPRSVVWAHLNDPETLRRCVPGCESLTREADDTFAAVVLAAIGPVKARFRGRLQLLDPVPGEGYRIAGKGEGGIAGFGSMEATVQLVDVPDGTQLSYRSEAQVGGKLAQIGSRLVGSVANKMAAEFFDNFEAAVTGAAP